MNRLLSILLLLTVLPGETAIGDEKPKPPDTSRGDKMIAEYFRQETARLTQQTKAEINSIKTQQQWQTFKTAKRQQLFEMLGLDPLPKKTPLHATVTSKVEHELFTVENLHFQSKPHLYVTGNLYIPKNLKAKAPAILYVCGHGRVKKNGISYGNKAHYQHHGGWFARNGYVCLTIDTLQLGEIEGIHHGTYKYDMWWWNARGYTSAGVEAWNCIRALDYLETRDEVDAQRMGVTGRSGGGAYSWWISSLDERIQAAVPVAGICSLKNHVVDGTIEGHCDCMFHVNTYRWDYPIIAALNAPRPLLISNTDKDGIFPLDGVVDVYTTVRPLYHQVYKIPRKYGLQITEGPHKDTQELRVHAFHWFNKYLKGEDPSPLIEMAAVKLFEPEQLRVFKKLPEDQINSEIQETFTAKAPAPEIPTDAQAWQEQKSKWMQALKQKCFRGWPETVTALDLKPIHTSSAAGIALSIFEFTSQDNIHLNLYLTHRAGLKPNELELVVLNVLDQEGWQDFLAMMKPAFAAAFKDEQDVTPDQKAFVQQQKMFQNFKWGMAFVCPRGIGPTIWNQNKRKQTQIRRRFMQLGQTRDSMRVWDARRAVQALRAVPGFSSVPMWLQGEREMAGIALYTALFEPNIKRLDLWHLPTSHRDGPIFLNVLRYLDTPAAVAMAAEKSQIRIYQQDKSGWEYPQQVADELGWDKKQFQLRVVKKPD